MAAISKDSYNTTLKNGIKKVAVFGATVQVGTPLAHTLLEKGHQVVAISRGRSANNESRLADLEKRGAQLACCGDLRRVEYQHYSTEYILDMKENAGDEITAKKGAETDKERWGINYVCYVAGKLATFNELTLRASELYPNYSCIKPVDVLKDLKFVFDTD